MCIPDTKNLFCHTFGMALNKVIAEHARLGDETIVIVSREIAYTNLRSKIAYKYELIKLDTLIQVVARNEDAQFHEYIKGDKPCRLFVDCDGRYIGEDNEALYVDYIKMTMAVSFFQRFQFQLPDPIVLTSSRKWQPAPKSSFHIIWPVWFELACGLDAFVKSVFPEDHMGMTVDMGVYPKQKSGHSSLRLPYCKKFNIATGKYIYPCVPWRAKSEFDINIFVRACLTYHVGQCSVFQEQVPLIPITEVAEGYTRIQDSGNRDIVNLVIDWFQAHNGACDFGCIMQGADNSFNFRCKMFCDVAGRVHAGNGIIVHGMPNGTITYMCMDEECRKFPVECEFIVQDLIAIDEADKEDSSLREKRSRKL